MIQWIKYMRDILLTLAINFIYYGSHAKTLAKYLTTTKYHKLYGLFHHVNQSQYSLIKAILPTTKGFLAQGQLIFICK